MFFIRTKGRTIKMSGLPIQRVPKGKVCLIHNFHIIHDCDSNTNEIVKYGEVSFVPNDTYSEGIILELMGCKFECK